MEYKIEIYSKPNDELKKYWNQFEPESYNYCFQSYEWFETWTKIFRNFDKDNICVVVAHHEGKILFILPLEILKKYNVKILQWLGGKHSDYFSPIISKNFDLSKERFIKLWNQIKNSLPDFDIILFNKQPLEVVIKKNPFVQFLNNHKDSVIYKVLLPESWENYSELTLKKKFRTQNIRSEKTLNKMGNLSFEIIPNSNEKVTFIDEIFNQKNDQLKSLGIKEIFEEKDINFYKAFEELKNKKIETHISCIKLDDQIIAAHWGIVYKNRFYYLLPSMNAKNLAKYSPGRILIENLIKWSIANKLQIFDFTLGDEKYKKSWCNSKSQLFNHLYLNSFKGVVLFIFLKSKLIIKSIDQHHYMQKTFFMIKKLLRL